MSDIEAAGQICSSGAMLFHLPGKAVDLHPVRSVISCKVFILDAKIDTPLPILSV